MKELKLTLVDTKKELVRCWNKEFKGYEVAIESGNIFKIKADAIVSPANSTGIMDGGFDFYLRDFFGLEIEKEVRIKIYGEYDGDMPVGAAFATFTGNNHYPYLITAPTMRVPMDVSNSLNAYLAMSAILRVALKHPKISSVVCTGLCSLSGKMPLPIVARQMKAAYERVVLKKYFFPHWIYETHFDRYLRCEIHEVPDPNFYEGKKV